MPPVFRQIPPLELVEQFLKCVGISSLSDYTWFSKQQIQLEVFEDLLPLLEPYYVPCKAKDYLYTTLTKDRAITILRQLLKAHNLSLTHSEKSSLGVKSIWYQIKGVLKQSSTEQGGVTIEFS